MFGYRTGAKQNHINQIRRMTEEGKTVDEISRALLIVPECVKSFRDHFLKKNNPPVQTQPVDDFDEENSLPDSPEDEPIQRKRGRPRIQPVDV